MREGFGCSICPRTFQSLQGLEMHIKHKHPGVRAGSPCQMQDADGKECGYPTMHKIHFHIGGGGGVSVPCCGPKEGHMVEATR